MFAEFPLLLGYFMHFSWHCDDEFLTLVGTERMTSTFFSYTSTDNYSDESDDGYPLKATASPSGLRPHAATPHLLVTFSGFTSLPSLHQAHDLLHERLAPSPMA